MQNCSHRDSKMIVCHAGGYLRPGRARARKYTAQPCQIAVHLRTVARHRRTAGTLCRGNRACSERAASVVGCSLCALHLVDQPAAAGALLAVQPPAHSSCSMPVSRDPPEASLCEAPPVAAPRSTSIAPVLCPARRCTNSSKNPCACVHGSSSV